MKVLFVASECKPFIKSGDLAEVISALPRALKKEGVDISVVLPKYKEIPLYWTEKIESQCNFEVSLSWRKKDCGVEKLEYKGIDYYFINNQYYFNRKGIYGHKDDAERFAFFNKAVLEMLNQLDFKPDILHCHDWQTALISVFLNTKYKDNPYYEKIKTILTVHELKYQGIFPKEVLSDVLGLSKKFYRLEELEYYGKINFLKGGLKYSDIITTPGEGYAKKIQKPKFGEGLHFLFKKRANDLYGITHGIENDIYDPAKDPHLFVNYENKVEYLNKKQENKTKLQKTLGLKVSKDIPLITIIDNFSKDKGFELMFSILSRLSSNKTIQLVILNIGKTEYRQRLRFFSWKFPQKVSTHITYNKDLVHKLYAAGDIFLSSFIKKSYNRSHLIALNYLNVPFVCDIQGLYDNIIDYNLDKNKGNSFVLDSFKNKEINNTISQVLSCYKNQQVWKQIIKNIQKCNYGWSDSAREYIKIYNNFRPVQSSVTK